MEEKRLEDFPELKEGNLVRVTFREFDKQETYVPGQGFLRRERHYPVSGYVNSINFIEMPMGDTMFRQYFCLGIIPGNKNFSPLFYPENIVSVEELVPKTE